MMRKKYFQGRGGETVPYAETQWIPESGAGNFGLFYG
jgi:hypothetical protein